MIAVGDDVLASETAAAAHVSVALEVGFAAADRGDAGAQHRDQPRLANRGGLEELADAGDLVLLDVDEKHVGAAALQLKGELLQEVALERADAKHEETS